MESTISSLSGPGLDDTAARIFEAFCVVANKCENTSDITMTAIANQLGITKPALFKRYTSVSEIIRSIHYYVNGEIEKKMMQLTKRKDQDILSLFAKEILPLMYKHRDVLYVLYGSVADASWIKYIENRYTPIIKPYLIDTQIEYGIDEDFAAKLFIRQTLSILARWLRSPNPETSITFEKTFLALMTHAPADLLKIPRPVLKNRKSADLE